MSFVYYADQELPAIPLAWTDGTGTLIDFSTGWTFTAKIVAATATSTVLVTKTSGITGTATTPNVVIDWSVTDFSTLTPAANGTEYNVLLYARRTADSKDRVFKPGKPIAFTLLPAAA